MKKLSLFLGVMVLIGIAVTQALAVRFNLADLEALKGTMSYDYGINHAVSDCEKDVIVSRSFDPYCSSQWKNSLMIDFKSVFFNSSNLNYSQGEMGLKPEGYSSDTLPLENLDISGDDTHLSNQVLYPYTVQVCSVRLKESAINIAKTSRMMGDFAFTSPAYLPEKGDWYRVFVGYYRTSEEAGKAAFALKKRKYPHAFVTKMPFAIQIDIPFHEDIKKVKAYLESNGCLAYSLSDRISDENTELLIGAFKIKKDAVRFMERLQEDNIKTRLVLR